MTLAVFLLLPIIGVLIAWPIARHNDRGRV